MNAVQLWLMWLALALATAALLFAGFQQRSATLLVAAVFGGWSGGVVSTRLYDRR